MKRSDITDEATLEADTARYEKRTEWKVGDEYSIVEHGKTIRGKIVSIQSGKHAVKWNDGTVTIEDEIDQRTK